MVPNFKIVKYVHLKNGGFLRLKIGKNRNFLSFGNPKVGTPLMQFGQTVAIDLPQKALVWQDESGQVWLTYNDPQYLATRHGIDGCKAVLYKVKNALKNFAQAATQP
ncbi:MAG: DUF302 domain-containing protein [Desulfobacterales bacterium]|jgi:uncharacterized protein (DUF302 family)